MFAFGTVLSGSEQVELRDWMRIRNMVVHRQESVTRAQVTEIVTGVLGIVERLRGLL